MTIPKPSQLRPWMLYVMYTAIVSLASTCAYLYHETRSIHIECQQAQRQERDFFREKLQICQEQALKTERDLNDYLKLQISINAQQQKQINRLKQ